MPPPGLQQSQAPTLPSIESIHDGISDDDLNRLPDSYAEGDDAGDPDADPAGTDDATDGPEVDPDDPEGGDDSQDETDAAEAATNAQTVKLKAEDGTESEVSIGDLKSKYQEYQKLDTFARKTYEELQQVGLKSHQAIEQNRNQYTESLQKFNDWIMAVVTPELQNVDLNQLAISDPAEYVRTKARIDQINGMLQRINSEQQSQKQLSNEEGQKARASAVQHSQRILREAIPNWNDQTYSSVLSTAVKSYGFRPDEIGSVIDPRVVKMAHDAMKWQEIQSGRSIAGKKVEKALPVTRPGQGRVVPRQAGKVAQARSNLRKTGSEQDAVRLLLSKGIR